MSIRLIASVLFAIILTALALTEDRGTRMLLIVPLLIIFYGTMLLSMVEYDRLMMKAWHQKEEKLKSGVKDYKPI